MWENSKNHLGLRLWYPQALSLPAMYLTARFNLKRSGSRHKPCFWEAVDNVKVMAVQMQWHAKPYSHPGWWQVNAGSSRLQELEGPYNHSSHALPSLFRQVNWVWERLNDFTRGSNATFHFTAFAFVQMLFIHWPHSSCSLCAVFQKHTTVMFLAVTVLLKFVLNMHIIFTLRKICNFSFKKFNHLPQIFW